MYLIYYLGYLKRLLYDSRIDHISYRVLHNVDNCTTFFNDLLTVCGQINKENKSKICSKNLFEEESTYIMTGDWIFQLSQLYCAEALESYAKPNSKIC